MTGLSAGDPPGGAWRLCDPDLQLGPTIEVSGATPQGIRWWVLRSSARALGLNGPEAFLGAQRRLRRRQLIADMLGPPTPRWKCPDCGSGQHGRPTWGLGSISTSDLLSGDEQWLALAVGPLELAIGIDLVASGLRPMAGRVMTRFLTPDELRQSEQVGLARMWARKEALSKARGTGLLGRPMAGEPGSPLDTLPQDPLADGVGIVDLDLGVNFPQVIASLAWIAAAPLRAPLRRSAGENPTFG